MSIRIRLGPGVLVVALACRDATMPTPNYVPPGAQPADAQTADPVVLATGDVVCASSTATPTTCQHAATAGLIGQVAPDAVFILGDIQYENGTRADFNAYYRPTWGAYDAIAHPAPGNHEYNTPGASGYYDYYNGVGVDSGLAGHRARGYYSYDLGPWHVIALNSNCTAIGGCGAGSAQEQWLRADLAAHSNACTVAYWHHPRFSSSSRGGNPSVQALWQALYDYKADLVLAGHEHHYERFGPQAATGAADAARGIRSFVVGTGGRNLTGFDTVQPNSEVRNNSSFGLLKLTLHPASFDWQFLAIPGNTLADAGSAACVTDAPPPPPPPPPPTRTTLTIPPSADAHVLRNSSWTNYGKATTLLVDGSPEARTYFKFAVSGIGARQVVSAKLLLYAVDPSDAGGRLHRVTSTSWTETGIKW